MNVCKESFVLRLSVSIHSALFILEIDHSVILAKYHSEKRSGLLSPWPSHLASLLGAVPHPATPPGSMRRVRHRTGSPQSASFVQVGPPLPVAAWEASKSTTISTPCALGRGYRHGSVGRRRCPREGAPTNVRVARAAGTQWRLRSKAATVSTSALLSFHERERVFGTNARKIICV